MPGRWRVTVAMGLVFLDMAPALQRDVRPHMVLRAPVAGYETPI
ncbi:hypothetical protein AB0H34_08325 [Saccharopolyspora shandongensis]